MGTRIALLTVAGILLGCGAEGAKADYSREVKYAVAYCLGDAYPGTAFQEDAEYAASGYLQSGDYGIDMYEQIRAFVNEYRKETYASKHGANLAIMQCLDLSQSGDLEKLIQKVAADQGIK